MAEIVRNRDDGDRLLGRAGALVGLVLGSGLGSLRMLAGSAPDLLSLGNLAFLAAFASPFAVALGALRLERATMRAAVWLGAGVLGVLGSMVALSGVSLILLLPGGLLVAAALRALRAGDTSPEWPVVLVPLWLVATGVAAFAALFQRDDQRSWSDGSAGHWTSDVITRYEGLASLGIWVAGLAVLATALWLWELAARRS